MSGKTCKEALKGQTRRRVEEALFTDDVGFG